jgi:hypothetical protein
MEIEDLLCRTRGFVKRMVSDCVQGSADDLLQWTLGRAMRCIVSTSLLVLAAAFLLLGGAEGLIVAGLPPYLAHVSMGVTSLLAGFLTLKCCANPRARN